MLGLLEEKMPWIESYKVPLGSLAKSLVDMLIRDASSFFDAASYILGAMINVLVAALQGPGEGYGSIHTIYPLIVAVMAGGLSWLARRSIAVSSFTVLGLLLIVNQGYWKETTETLALVLASTAVSMLVGVPLGIAAARRSWIYSALRPVLDLMQTIPTFVYLIPALILFGLGMVPGLIATVIFAIPAPIRLTRLGIIATPSSLVEAAKAFGATSTQVLTKVELPYALPQIMAGLTQTIMLSLSMVVVAALVGANGLGVPVVRALNSVNVAKGFEAGLCIVVLAVILDRSFRLPEAGDEA